MCLTLPAKIISVNGYKAEISVNGRTTEVAIGTSDNLQIGDWVLYTNDYLIKKISEQEAAEITDLLSSYPVQKNDLPEDFIKIIEKKELELSDVEYLLSIEDEKLLQALYAQANVVRKANIKDHICLHGIIEFSSYCRNDCHYCGLRRSNDSCFRYRMTTDQLVETAVNAVNQRGYKILVLQSGEDTGFSDDSLIKAISVIKKKSRVFLYLSVGDRPFDSYLKFKQAGIGGVLYRFETTNANLYQKMHPGKSLDQRMEYINFFKQSGFVLATGSLVGLPLQTNEDIARDILKVKEIEAFMPSYGPLVPSKMTPLSNEKIVDEKMLLKIIAITRLILPRSRITVTTAMETLYGEQIRHKAFMAGANSLMFNLTPDEFRKQYYIYQNKFFDEEKKFEKWGLFKGELSYQMMEQELKIKI